MRHKRGIDFSAAFTPATYVEENLSVYRTLSSLAQWEVLGGKCRVCPHIGWVDKDAVMRAIGNHYLVNVAAKMSCPCGNKTDNRLLIGRLPR